MEMIEFQEKIKKALQEYGGSEMTVRISKVRKNNGHILTGVSMYKPGSNITPTLYIDDYLKRYEEGITFGEIMKDIIYMLENYAIDREMDISFFTEWDRAKRRIVYRLINAEKNEELLKEVPYIPFMDLAIVFYYLMGDKSMGNASIMIHKKHLAVWEVEEKSLYDVAVKNTHKMLPYAIQNISQLMRDVLFENIGKQMGEKGCTDKECVEEITDRMMEQLSPIHQQVNMYVLSNNSRYYGAACILYKDLLRKFAESYDADIYILPSSVHEMILLPDRGGEDPVKLAEMVRDVNDTQLSPEEVLSDSVYYYDRKSGEIRMLQSEQKAADAAVTA